ncbi:hypothetical protein [Ectobacillus ponti]|uniref:NAD(P)-binding domain-containing protein n=1 Tax=Ectobacillus ponti TaxID=2961894 RepID=A0AA41X392_9BACI|nr:hypothetical protein [Ectobacillus ponti]MCP8967817.1 hypothetical protein [Ectobacillus ponti]
MILIIGGSGEAADLLAEKLLWQHRVVVLQQEQAGIPWRAVFEKGQPESEADLDRVFSRYSVDAVIYTAASERLTRSVRLVLEKMREYRIPHFIFSAKVQPQEERAVEQLLQGFRQSISGQLAQCVLLVERLLQGEGRILQV